MGYFKNKNYCIDKSVLKTCRRGGVSIILPSLKKYIYIKKQLSKNKVCLHRVSNPVRQARRRACYPPSYFGWELLGVEKAYLCKPPHRVICHRNAGSRRTRRAWRHDVNKAGNKTCFRINCLLAEATHVILWSNRYDRVDKYLLYWIPGCRYTVQWFNCRPGLLRHDTWRCRGFFAFSWTKSLWP